MSVLESLFLLPIFQALGWTPIHFIWQGTVIGWLRPVILLPTSALTGLSPSHLEAILLHELAHIRRLDYLINLLQTIVETLLFYHSAVWWVSRRIRIERENCCDDVAVSVLGGSRDYATALARMEGTAGGAPCSGDCCFRRLAFGSDPPPVGPSPGTPKL